VASFSPSSYCVIFKRVTTRKPAVLRTTFRSSRLVLFLRLLTLALALVRPRRHHRLLSSPPSSAHAIFHTTIVPSSHQPPKLLTTSMPTHQRPRFSRSPRAFSLVKRAAPLAFPPSFSSGDHSQTQTQTPFLPYAASYEYTFTIDADTATPVFLFIVRTQTDICRLRLIPGKPSTVCTAPSGFKNHVMALT